jgi:hypothetical protein
MKITHIIQGFFWQGDPKGALQSPFIGEINVDESGAFEGHTTDHYGSATIKGRIDGSALEFEKNYEMKSKGAKGGICYLLRAQGYKDSEGIICGGWKGVYRILQPQNPGPGDCESFRCGEASCLIYPAE